MFVFVAHHARSVHGPERLCSPLLPDLVDPEQCPELLQHTEVILVAFALDSLDRRSPPVQICDLLLQGYCALAIEKAVGWKLDGLTTWSESQVLHLLPVLLPILSSASEYSVFQYSLVYVSAQIFLDPHVASVKAHPASVPAHAMFAWQKQVSQKQPGESSRPLPQRQLSVCSAVQVSFVWL